MAQPDYGYNPSAGYVPPPGNSIDPGYSPYGNIYANDAQRPKHPAYDPHTGQPIPPGFEPPPTNANQQDYPPPPRDDQYGDDPYGQPPPGRSDHDRGYYGGPPSAYGYPGGTRGYGDRDRQYAPDEPYPHDGNAITPFDEEKYEAEVRDEQARRYAAQPPPPGDYFDRDRRRGAYPDDRRRDSRDRYDDRYSDGDSYYDTRDRDPRDRRYEDERDRRYSDRDRRRDSRQKDEPRSPKQRAKDVFDGREAQVLGGAAGGLIGSQLGGGVLETLGGAFVGAVGAKVLEKQKIKRDGKKISGEAPSRREIPAGAPPRRDIPREDLRRDPRDDRREPRGDPRYRSGRSRSRDYSDEYSPSPPPPGPDMKKSKTDRSSYCQRLVASLDQPAKPPKKMQHCAILAMPTEIRQQILLDTVSENEVTTVDLGRRSAVLSAVCRTFRQDASWVLDQWTLHRAKLEAIHRVTFGNYIDDLMRAANIDRARVDAQQQLRKWSKLRGTKRALQQEDSIQSHGGGRRTCACISDEANTSDADKANHSTQDHPFAALTEWRLSKIRELRQKALKRKQQIRRGDLGFHPSSETAEE